MSLSPLLSCSNRGVGSTAFELGFARKEQWGSELTRGQWEIPHRSTSLPGYVNPLWRGLLSEADHFLLQPMLSTCGTNHKSRCLELLGSPSLVARHIGMDTSNASLAQRRVTRRALSSRTPTSRCRCATAGRRVRARESPPGAGRAATGTRAALRSRPLLPARQHVRP